MKSFKNTILLIFFLCAAFNNLPGQNNETYAKVQILQEITQENFFDAIKTPQYTESLILTNPEEVKSFITNYSLFINLRVLQIISDNALDCDSVFPKLSKLIFLRINQSNLKRLPTSLEKIGNLQYLDFAGNFLTKMPLQLPNLKYLDMGDAMYGGNQISLLSDSINSLIKLEVLFLSLNPIESLPDGLSKLQNLKILILDQTNVSNLGTNFGNLSSLNELSIAYTKIALLPAGLKKIKTLNSLNLLGLNVMNNSDNIAILTSIVALNDLTISVDKLQKLHANFFSLQSLKRLNINDVLALDFKILGKELKRMPALTVVFINNAKLRPGEKTDFIEGLKPIEVIF